jgi:hypothetical protein
MHLNLCHLLQTIFLGGSCYFVTYLCMITQYGHSNEFYETKVWKCVDKIKYTKLEFVCKVKIGLKWILNNKSRHKITVERSMFFI